MFKDKALKVSLIKTTPDGEIDTSSIQTTADTIAFAVEAAKPLMDGVLKIVVTYVTLDTARKLILALVTK
jgi:hypothetical protein